MNYIDQLNIHNLSEYSKKLYEYGINNQVPIMELNGISHIMNLIRVNKIKKVLEIGCAISFTAHMYLDAQATSVITFERDAKMFEIASQFVKEGPYPDKIQIINEDALLFDESGLDSDFDLLVIDAAKGQNIKFFEKYEKKVKRGGLIITDNILFHGCCEEIDQSKLTKNVRGIVSKIKDYCRYLQNRADFETVFLPVGDGQAVCVKK